MMMEIDLAFASTGPKNLNHLSLPCPRTSLNPTPLAAVALSLRSIAKMAGNALPTNAPDNMNLNALVYTNIIGSPYFRGL